MIKLIGIQGLKRNDEMIRDWAAEAEAKKALRVRQEFEASPEYQDHWDPEEIDLRMALINLDEGPIEGFEFLHDLSRSDLTDLCINDLSLCPIHLVDWAICFDDQPDDCSQVRFIYPDNHDT